MTNKRNAHVTRRRKVNNLCRCTPKGGIIAMHPDYAGDMFDHELRRLLSSSNPGYIAGHAMLIGETLRHSGRPRLALHLMQCALSHLMNVDFNKQEDYASKHYYPRPEYVQWYAPWSARVSEADARQLAARIDELKDDINRHLGHHERSHIRFRIHDRYEAVFDYIYEV